MMLSFRTRLALTMGLLIFCIAAAIWIYLPRKLEEEAVALIRHKAETLAQLTAFTVHPAVYFGDRTALVEALRGTISDRDVSYVVVTDNAGNQLSAHYPERATAAALARTASGGALSADRSLYEVTAPIRDGSAVLARLHIGISLERVRNEIDRIRMRIGLLSAFILLAGLLGVALVSGALTRPLRELTAAARGIASGEIRDPVPEGRNDEIGELAVAFNDMAARVEERNSAVRRSRDQLRLLSRRLFSAQEQERVRIAREVHDELGPALTALKIDLQQVARRNPNSEPEIATIAGRIDTIVDLVRRIASDLRPSILDDLGVTAALEQQLRRLRESTGIDTSLHVAEEPELDMLTGVTLYRIAQEALANVVRHSRATEVAISLAIREGWAVMTIRDNGTGIRPEQIAHPRSLGLLGMRERAELLAGQVQIESPADGGTLVTVTLPLARES